MVLKALFVGAVLHLIYGLDTRANSTLAQMAMTMPMNVGQLNAQCSGNLAPGNLATLPC